MKIDPKTGKITWTPDDRTAGTTVEVTIQVCDKAGACDKQTWKIKVKNINDTPKIDSTPADKATEDKLYTLCQGTKDIIKGLKKSEK
jgi:hypothetical protein